MEAETDAYLHHHEYCCHSDAGGSCHGDGKLPVQHRMFMHGSSATAKPAQGLKVSQVALGAAGSSLLQAGAGTKDAEVMKVGCHPVAAPGSSGDRAESPEAFFPIRSANTHLEAQAPRAGTRLRTAGGEVKEHCWPQSLLVRRRTRLCVHTQLCLSFGKGTGTHTAVLLGCFPSAVLIGMCAAALWLSSPSF